MKMLLLVMRLIGIVLRKLFKIRYLVPSGI